MIEYRKGDIFKSEAKIIINPCNCVGVMGKGLALQFKNNFPDNFSLYKEACDQGLLKPGTLFIVDLSDTVIINFPTKRHWKDSSYLEDIDKGLQALAAQLKKSNWESIALPALGCGLGGLDWALVKSLIEQYLNSFENIHIIVYEP